MSKDVFSRYDSADYLKSDEDIVAYLEAVIDEGGDDPAYLTRAIGVVARARNLSKLSRDIGMSRQGLDKALSGKGNPSFVTVVKLLKALGLQVALRPLAPPKENAPPASRRGAALRH